MDDLDFSIRKKTYFHEIEAVQIAGPAVPRPPHFGQLGHGAALAPPDGLGSDTKLGPRAGLHLYERDEIVAAHDQIQVVPAQAETMIQDAPALSGEIADGQTFSPHSQPVARVTPGLDAKTDPSGHAAKDGRRRPEDRARFHASGGYFNAASRGASVSGSRLQSDGP